MADELNNEININDIADVKFKPEKYKQQFSQALEKSGFNVSSTHFEREFYDCVAMYKLYDLYYNGTFFKGRRSGKELLTQKLEITDSDAEKMIQFFKDFDKKNKDHIKKLVQIEDIYNTIITELPWKDLAGVITEANKASNVNIKKAVDNEITELTNNLIQDDAAHNLDSSTDGQALVDNYGALTQSVANKAASESVNSSKFGTLLNNAAYFSKLRFASRVDITHEEREATGIKPYSDHKDTFSKFLNEMKKTMMADEDALYASLEYNLIDSNWQGKNMGSVLYCLEITPQKYRKNSRNFPYELLGAIKDNVKGQIDMPPSLSKVTSRKQIEQYQETGKFPFKMKDNLQFVFDDIIEDGFDDFSRPDLKLRWEYNPGYSRSAYTAGIKSSKFRTSVDNYFDALNIKHDEDYTPDYQRVIDKISSDAADHFEEYYKSNNRTARISFTLDLSKKEYKRRLKKFLTEELKNSDYIAKCRNAHFSADEKERKYDFNAEIDAFCAGNGALPRFFTEKLIQKAADKAYSEVISTTDIKVDYRVLETGIKNYYERDNLKKDVHAMLAGYQSKTLSYISDDTVTEFYNAVKAAKLTVKEPHEWYRLEIDKKPDNGVLSMAFDDVVERENILRYARMYKMYNQSLQEDCNPLELLTASTRGTDGITQQDINNVINFFNNFNGSSSEEREKNVETLNAMSNVYFDLLNNLQWNDLVELSNKTCSSVNEAVKKDTVAKLEENVLDMCLEGAQGQLTDAESISKNLRKTAEDVSHRTASYIANNSEIAAILRNADYFAYKDNNAAGYLPNQDDLQYKGIDNYKNYEDALAVLDLRAFAGKNALASSVVFNIINPLLEGKSMAQVSDDLGRPNFGMVKKLRDELGGILRRDTVANAGSLRNEVAYYQETGILPYQMSDAFKNDYEQCYHNVLDRRLFSDRKISPPSTIHWNGKNFTNDYCREALNNLKDNKTPAGKLFNQKFDGKTNPADILAATKDADIKDCTPEYGAAIKKISSDMAEEILETVKNGYGFRSDFKEIIEETLRDYLIADGYLTKCRNENLQSGKKESDFDEEIQNFCNGTGMLPSFFSEDVIDKAVFKAYDNLRNRYNISWYSGEKAKERAEALNEVTQADITAGLRKVEAVYAGREPFEYSEEKADEFFAAVENADLVIDKSSKKETLYRCARMFRMYNQSLNDGNPIDMIQADTSAELCNGDVFNAISFFKDFNLNREENLVKLNEIRNIYATTFGRVKWHDLARLNNSALEKLNNRMQANVNAAVANYINDNSKELEKLGADGSAEQAEKLAADLADKAKVFVELKDNPVVDLFKNKMYYWDSVAGKDDFFPHGQGEKFENIKDTAAYKASDEIYKMIIPMAGTGTAAITSSVEFDILNNMFSDKNLSDVISAYNMVDNGRGLCAALDDTINNALISQIANEKDIVKRDKTIREKDSEGNIIERQVEGKAKINDADLNRSAVENYQKNTALPWQMKDTLQYELEKACADTLHAYGYDNIPEFSTLQWQTVAKKWQNPVMQALRAISEKPKAEENRPDVDRDLLSKITRTMQSYYSQAGENDLQAYTPDYCVAVRKISSDAAGALKEFYDNSEQSLDSNIIAEFEQRLNSKINEDLIKNNYLDSCRKVCTDRNRLYKFNDEIASFARGEKGLPKYFNADTINESVKTAYGELKSAHPDVQALDSFKDEDLASSLNKIQSEYKSKAEADITDAVAERFVKAANSAGFNVPRQNDLLEVKDSIVRYSRMYKMYLNRDKDPLELLTASTEGTNGVTQQDVENITKFFEDFNKDGRREENRAKINDIKNIYFDTLNRITWEQLTELNDSIIKSTDKVVNSSVVHSLEDMFLSLEDTKLNEKKVRKMLPDIKKTIIDVANQTTKDVNSAGTMLLLADSATYYNVVPKTGEYNYFPYEESDLNDKFNVDGLSHEYLDFMGIVSVLRDMNNSDDKAVCASLTKDVFDSMFKGKTMGEVLSALPVTRENDSLYNKLYVAISNAVINDKLPEDKLSALDKEEDFLSPKKKAELYRQTGKLPWEMNDTFRDDFEKAYTQTFLDYGIDPKDIPEPVRLHWRVYPYPARDYFEQIGADSDIKILNDASDILCFNNIIPGYYADKVDFIPGYGKATKKIGGDAARTFNAYLTEEGSAEKFADIVDNNLKQLLLESGYIKECRNKGYGGVYSRVECAYNIEDGINTFVSGESSLPHFFTPDIIKQAVKKSLQESQLNIDYNQSASLVNKLVQEYAAINAPAAPEKAQATQPAVLNKDVKARFFAAAQKAGLEVVSKDAGEPAVSSEITKYARLYNLYLNRENGTPLELLSATPDAKADAQNVDKLTEFFENFGDGETREENISKLKDIEGIYFTLAKKIKWEEIEEQTERANKLADEAAEKAEIQPMWDQSFGMLTSMFRSYNYYRTVYDTYIDDSSKIIAASLGAANEVAENSFANKILANCGYYYANGSQIFPRAAGEEYTDYTADYNNLTGMLNVVGAIPSGSEDAVFAALACKMIEPELNGKDIGDMLQGNKAGLLNDLYTALKTNLKEKKFAGDESSSVQTRRQIAEAQEKGIIPWEMDTDMQQKFLDVCVDVFKKYRYTPEQIADIPPIAWQNNRIRNLYLPFVDIFNRVKQTVPDQYNDAKKFGYWCSLLKDGWDAIAVYEKDFTNYKDSGLSVPDISKATAKIGDDVAKKFMQNRNAFNDNLLHYGNEPINLEKVAELVNEYAANLKLQLKMDIYADGYERKYKDAIKSDKKFDFEKNLRLFCEGKGALPRFFTKDVIQAAVQNVYEQLKTSHKEADKDLSQLEESIPDIITELVQEYEQREKEYELEQQREQLKEEQQSEVIEVPEPAVYPEGPITDEELEAELEEITAAANAAGIAFDGSKESAEMLIKVYKQYANNLSADGLIDGRMFCTLSDCKDFVKFLNDNRNNKPELAKVETGFINALKNVAIPADSKGQERFKNYVFGVKNSFADVHNMLYVPYVPYAGGDKQSAEAGDIAQSISKIIDKMQNGRNNGEKMAYAALYNTIQNTLKGMTVEQAAKLFSATYNGQNVIDAMVKPFESFAVQCQTQITKNGDALTDEDLAAYLSDGTLSDNIDSEKFRSLYERAFLRTDELIKAQSDQATDLDKILLEEQSSAFNMVNPLYIPADPDLTNVINAFVKSELPNGNWTKKDETYAKLLEASLRHVILQDGFAKKYNSAMFPQDIKNDLVNYASNGLFQPYGFADKDGNSYFNTARSRAVLGECAVYGVSDRGVFSVDYGSRFERPAVISAEHPLLLATKEDAIPGVVDFENIDVPVSRRLKDQDSSLGKCFGEMMQNYPVFEKMRKNAYIYDSVSNQAGFFYIDGVSAQEYASKTFGARYLNANGKEQSELTNTAIVWAMLKGDPPVDVKYYTENEGVCQVNVQHICTAQNNRSLSSFAQSRESKRLEQIKNGDTVAKRISENKEDCINRTHAAYVAEYNHLYNQYLSYVRDIKRVQDVEQLNEKVQEKINENKKYLLQAKDYNKCHIFSEEVRALKECLDIAYDGLGTDSLGEDFIDINHPDLIRLAKYNKLSTANGYLQKDILSGVDVDVSPMDVKHLVTVDLLRSDTAAINYTQDYEYYSEREIKDKLLSIQNNLISVAEKMTIADIANPIDTKDIAANKDKIVQLNAVLNDSRSFFNNIKDYGYDSLSLKNKDVKSSSQAYSTVLNMLGNMGYAYDTQKEGYGKAFASALLYRTMAPYINGKTIKDIGNTYPVSGDGEGNYLGTLAAKYENCFKDMNITRKEVDKFIQTGICPDRFREQINSNVKNTLADVRYNYYITRRYLVINDNDYPVPTAVESDTDERLTAIAGRIADDNVKLLNDVLESTSIDGKLLQEVKENYRKSIVDNIKSDLSNRYFKSCSKSYEGDLNSDASRFVNSKSSSILPYFIKSEDVTNAVNNALDKLKADYPKSDKIGKFNDIPHFNTTSRTPEPKWMHEVYANQQDLAETQRILQQIEQEDARHNIHIRKNNCERICAGVNSLSDLTDEQVISLSEQFDNLVETPVIKDSVNLPGVRQACGNDLTKLFYINGKTTDESYEEEKYGWRVDLSEEQCKKAHIMFNIIKGETTSQDKPTADKVDVICYEPGENNSVVQKVRTLRYDPVYLPKQAAKSQEQKDAEKQADFTRTLQAAYQDVVLGQILSAIDSQSAENSQHNHQPMNENQQHLSADAQRRLNESLGINRAPAHVSQDPSNREKTPEDLTNSAKPKTPGSKI